MLRDSSRTGKRVCKPRFAGFPSRYGEGLLCRAAEDEVLGVLSFRYLMLLSCLVKLQVCLVKLQVCSKVAEAAFPVGKMKRKREKRCRWYLSNKVFGGFCRIQCAGRALLAGLGSPRLAWCFEALAGSSGERGCIRGRLAFPSLTGTSVLPVSPARRYLFLFSLVLQSRWRCQHWRGSPQPPFPRTAIILYLRRRIPSISTKKPYPSYSAAPTSVWSVATFNLPPAPRRRPHARPYVQCADYHRKSRIGQSAWITLRNG